MFSAEEARKKIAENQMNHIMAKIQEEIDGGAITNTFSFDLKTRLLPETEKEIEELGWTVKSSYDSLVRDTNNFTITISC